MGLEVEDVEEKDRHKAVADYVCRREDFAPTDESWEVWLQAHRVELNAMTTPRSSRGLIPRWPAMASSSRPQTCSLPNSTSGSRKKLREAITERIMREAGFEELVANAVARTRNRLRPSWLGAFRSCSSGLRIGSGAITSRRCEFENARSPVTSKPRNDFSRSRPLRLTEMFYLRLGGNILEREQFWTDAVGG